MRSTAAVTGRAQCAGSSTKPWSTTLQAVEAAAEAYPEIRLGRRRKAEASSQVPDVPFPWAVSARCFLLLHTNKPTHGALPLWPLEWTSGSRIGSPCRQAVLCGCRAPLRAVARMIVMRHTVRSSKHHTPHRMLQQAAGLCSGRQPGVRAQVNHRPEDTSALPLGALERLRRRAKFRGGAPLRAADRRVRCGPAARGINAALGVHDELPDKAEAGAVLCKDRGR